MKHDSISEIEIDELEKLHLKPFEKITLIYKTAIEASWNKKKLTIYSPEPGDWNYLAWLQHIVNVEKKKALLIEIDRKTKWTNLPDGLK